MRTQSCRTGSVNSRVELQGKCQACQLRRCHPEASNPDEVGNRINNAVVDFNSAAPVTRRNGDVRATPRRG